MSQLLNKCGEGESGKKHKNRQQLLAGVGQCEQSKAVMLIARLDRLVRSVAFISSLMEKWGRIRGRYPQACRYCFSFW
jgi:hypothetical protein